MQSAQGRIVPVILCGGTGSRLWPASRPECPKPFLPLLGDQSSFNQTLQRVADPGQFTHPLIIASEPSLQALETALGKTRATVLLEPLSRNTGPAVAIAARSLAARDADALMLVLAADHDVPDHAGFQDAVLRGLPLAKAGNIVVFGIPPTTPATAYGYIQPGRRLGQDSFAVAAFHEKPDAETALKYVMAGCQWNSGNLLCKAAVMCDEIDKHAPALSKSVNAVTGYDSKLAHIDPAILSGCPSVSIDRAVLEKTSKAVVINVSYSWSDLGKWPSVWAASIKDLNGNRVQGPVSHTACTNTLLYSDRRKISATALQKLIIVCSADDVLVAALPGLASPLTWQCRLPDFFNGDDGELCIGGIDMPHATRLDLPPHASASVVILTQGASVFCTKGEELHMVTGEAYNIARGQAVTLLTTAKEDAAIVQLWSS
jgi:mannose-1-phosphate guanylyltransferase / mannose-6-phosphate isomerase